VIRVAIATCKELPNLDEDGPLLLEQLRKREVRGTPVVWDDPAVPWDSFDAVVLRSTWDYPAKWTSFSRWIDDVGKVTKLLNPAPVVRWNLDKRYLRQLAEAGVPVVPTQWIESEQTAFALQASEVVVKPVISAGSKDTQRFFASDREGMEALVSRILASRRAVMVQPYLRGVDDHGETALLFFRGVHSHSIRKAPLLRVGVGRETGLFRPEGIDMRTASADELALANRVLDSLPFPRTSLAYARVDLVPGEDGSPCVIEVELIEPSLFLQYDPGACGRFADALVATLSE
jgi:hypothetical protein